MSWPPFDIKKVFPGLGIPIIIRWFWDCLYVLYQNSEYCYVSVNKHTVGISTLRIIIISMGECKKDVTPLLLICSIDFMHRPSIKTTLSFAPAGVSVTPVDDMTFQLFAPNQAAMLEAQEAIEKLLTEEVRMVLTYSIFNTLRPRQNGRHFSDGTFKCIFLSESLLKFVPKGPINNIPALVQIMAWRQRGDEPLSEPMLVRLVTSHTNFMKFPSGECQRT